MLVITYSVNLLVAEYVFSEEESQEYFVALMVKFVSLRFSLLKSLFEKKFKSYLILSDDHKIHWKNLLDNFFR